jgi:hypothetical protein
MKTRGTALALGFALTLAAPATFGNAFFPGPNPITGNLTWSGFSDGSVAATISGPIPNVNAGQFQGLFDTDGGVAENDDFFRFFCIDISQTVSGGPNTYTRDIGVPASKLTQLTRLFDLYYPNKTIGTYYSGGVTDFGRFSDANASAAFQLALWEIWFGDGTDLSGIPFTASSAVTGTAQGYLTAVNGASGTPDGWTFYTFTNDSYQDYLSVEYSVPLRTTPEPGTLVLLCSAVLAACVTALRRRQTA